VNKKKQKNFVYFWPEGSGADSAHGAKQQKFFASFFQKSSAFFLA
jgi:hypothetical protein